MEQQESTEVLANRIHWTQLQSPNIGTNMSAELLTGEIILTQKGLLKSQSSKYETPIPYLVTYDVDYLKYRLIEIVAPILVGLCFDSFLLDKTTDFTEESVVTKMFLELFEKSLSESFNFFVTYLEKANDLEMPANISRKTFCQVYKHALQ